MHTREEPYDSLLEIIESEIERYEGDDPNLIFDSILKSADNFVLGKIEMKPKERAKWLMAIKNLKADLKRKLLELSKN